MNNKCIAYELIQSEDNVCHITISLIIIQTRVYVISVFFKPVRLAG